MKRARGRRELDQGSQGKRESPGKKKKSCQRSDAGATPRKGPLDLATRSLVTLPSAKVVIYFRLGWDYHLEGSYSYLLLQSSPRPGDGQVRAEV